MEYQIPFNKPCIVGKELHYIAQAVSRGNISCDGYFTQRCARVLEERFGIIKVLVTPSCTAALELCALLIDLKEGDEVIIPSFTFVSTANAFVRQGARPVFVEVRGDTFNIDESAIEAAISPRTKAIFPIHYAGIACEMQAIMEIAERHGLFVAEDAAQGVNAMYHGQALGSIGHMGTYSFHETKNVTCGQGGALCINSPELIERAEILRDKGTNRAQFFRGEVDKYSWVDVGSAYVPSEISSAFLCAQLEELDVIAKRRKEIYERYYEELAPLECAGELRLHQVPDHCQGNHHIFHVLLCDAARRDALLSHLNQNGINAVFHYVPLHASPMGDRFGYKPGDLPVTEDISSRLLRLPIFYSMTDGEQSRVIAEVISFFKSSRLAPAATCNEYS